MALWSSVKNRSSVACLVLMRLIGQSAVYTHVLNLDVTTNSYCVWLLYCAVMLRLNAKVLYVVADILCREGVAGLTVGERISE